MKIFYGIAYLVLIATFLVSTAGVHLTRHTCLESGRSYLVLDQDFACCDLKDGLAGNEAVSDEDAMAGEASECCAAYDVMPGKDAMSGEASDCCAPDDAMTGTAAACCEAESTACELGSKSGAATEHAGKQHEDCCVEQHHYLKSDQDFSKPNQTELPSIKFHLLPATLAGDHHMIQGLRPEAGTHDPPLVLHTDPLISHGALLL